MPTLDACAALTEDAARALVATHCFSPRAGAAELGKVGLEAESFPIWQRADGAPDGRVTLADQQRAGSATVLADLGWSEATVSGLACSWLPNSARVTFEPGGQVEVATCPRDTAAAALDDLDTGTATLARAYGHAGAGLAAAGMDVWHDPASIAQQLAAPRYALMAAYLARRGPDGHTMMCHSASLQVNLCLGPPAVAAERWLVANLLTPMIVATFAASPDRGRASGRAHLWRRLDPTRTGVPARLVDGTADDPVDQATDVALRADVMLTRGFRGWRAGHPGRAFGAWLREGHPEMGWPTSEDFVYHLTTLFPEVRARGFLELRGVDALPARWRAVPVVLLVGALYDATARARIRDVLERHRRSLPNLLVQATGRGVADPAMCALAVETWSLALAGAARLPAGYLRPGDLPAVEAFLDRFTLRGRCPSDELAERLATSPTAALAWASDTAEAMSSGVRG